MRGTTETERTHRGNATGESKSETEASLTDVHEILFNERRRALLRILKGATEESLTMRELSERLATRETGEDPAPRDARHSVYVALQQHHLPKLDDSGVIEREQDRVSLSESPTTREVYAHLEAVPKYGLAWAEYYFLLSVTSLLSIVASALAIPPFAAVAPLHIALAALFVHMLSNAYQTRETGNSFVTRVTAWDWIPLSAGGAFDDVDLLDRLRGDRPSSEPRRGGGPVDEAD
jgi:hypothetical protein